VTGFRGSDDRGRVADPLTPENLRPLLWEAQTSVVVERVGDGPAAQARATRAPGGRWTMRVDVMTGAGAGQEPLAATVPNTDAAFDALRSWAADDGWWREAFTWTPVDRAGG